MQPSWSSRKVAIVGPSGRETLHEARVPDFVDESGQFTAVSVIVTVVLVGTGLFFPPVLLLSLPILIGRAAVGIVRMGKYERVRLDGFPCPECGGDNPPGERKGELPIDVACERCRAKLTVGQVRRIYRADPA